MVKVIQTLRCSTRRHAKICKFLKVVIKNTKPIMLKKRRKKARAIAIRSHHYFNKPDGVVYLFSNNSLVLLKKRMNTLGKALIGPTAKALKIRKFRVPFRCVF